MKENNATVETVHDQGQSEKVKDYSDVKKTRKDLHIPRRLFHMAGGLIIGLIYQLLLTHQGAIHILGTAACAIYVLEQVRINYPEFATKVAPFSKYLFRAEEQLKESAGVPYLMGLLLTIISFPKLIALVAIYTLAIGDPLSAVIGIRFGKTHIVKEKSLEGSLAFFLACFSISMTVFFLNTEGHALEIWIISFLGALGVSLFEMLPVKIDDNLTIPLVSAFWFWILSAFIDIPFV